MYTVELINGMYVFKDERKDITHTVPSKMQAQKIADFFEKKGIKLEGAEILVIEK